MKNKNPKGQALILFAIGGAVIVLLLIIPLLRRPAQSTTGIELSAGVSLGEAARAAQVAAIESYVEQIDADQHRMGKYIIFYVIPNATLDCPNKGEIGFTIKFPFFWADSNWRPGQSMSGKDFEYNLCAKPGSLPPWNAVKAFFAAELTKYALEKGIDPAWIELFVRELKELTLYMGRLPGGG